MDASPTIPDPPWTLEIRPEERLLHIDFREIWKYRELFQMLVTRDIVTIYKQTVLGPLWFFIQPVLTTVMYMVVFGGIARISTDGLPQPLFYLSGICLWQYFADCLRFRPAGVFNASAPTKAAIGKLSERTSRRKQPSCPLLAMETPLSTARRDTLFDVIKAAMMLWGVWGQNL